MAGERLPVALAEALEERLREFAADDVGGRIWAADPTLWKPGAAAHQQIIANALGWVGVWEDVRDEIAELTQFVADVRAEGFRSAVLLGMGGSSLAPEVFSAILGDAEGALELHVLDSTDPAAVLAVEAAVDLDRTLFIVASKSGGTTETASFHAYFYDRLQAHCAEHAGSHFVAITDEGTSLEQLALAQGFRAIFVNPSDIGGRYSALSFFGLVPAALLGVDLERLLDGVDAMAAACGPDVPAAQNPALRLGAAMGELALHGRDKLTLICEAPLTPLGAWIEQLVAESTGKEGLGVLPVDLEPLGSLEQYGDDRVFCGLRLAGAGGVAAGRLDALAEAGHPLLERELADAYGVGGEMLCWELATAAAGVVLGIDPFDQPNVQESKDRTKALLAASSAAGAHRTRTRAGRRSPTQSATRGCRTPCARSLRRPYPATTSLSRRMWRPERPSGSSCRPCVCNCATACVWPPPWGLGRATCTPPGSSTREGRTAACSCSSWGMILATWRSRGRRMASACSSALRRAATSPRCGHTTAARCVCVSATTCRRA